MLGLKVLIPVLATLWATTGALSAPPSDLASDLARLRTDVEALHAELELERESQRSELRTLAQQKAEVEAELRRAERRTAKLTQAYDKLKEDADAASATRASFGPTWERCAAIVKQLLGQSLPFKKAERIGGVDTLLSQVKEGKLAAPTALARLWGVVEDELRLSRETGLYRQTIELDGQRVLADVVKVGMVMLFFQTADGRVGKAVGAGERFRYELFDTSSPESAAEAQGVVALFDAMKKGIKTGFFELPNILISLSQKR